MRITTTILAAVVLGFTAHSMEVNRAMLGKASHCLNNSPVEVKVNAANYCIVEKVDGAGFAVLKHCSDGSARVVGYSPTGRWQEEDMPPALLEWLEHIGNMPAVKPLTDNNSSRESVSPLLTCHWHQTSPYNDMAPVIEDGNIKTVAGCVAIAASQITYYWRNDNPPATLQDTPIYPYGQAPVTMSIPAGSPNHWEAMLDDYNGVKDSLARAAAAQLCYVVGTTSYLDYGSSTGGQIHEAAIAILIQYDLLSDYISKSNVTQEQWDSLLYAEVANSRPVMCSGQGSGGHAFVLDGYDSETGLYHFNFGWGGVGDGYFAIDDSEEAMGGYYQGQSVVYNIHPKTRNLHAEMTATGVDDTGDEIKVRITITNGSTLPVKKLALHIVPPGEQWDKTAEPAWQSDEAIDNDGEPHKIKIVQASQGLENNTQFYLTDDSGALLATCTLDYSAVEDVKIDETDGKTVIYDLNGHEVKDPQPNTIYIIKDGKSARKIIINSSF